MNKKILIISAVFPPEPIVSAKLSYDLALEISKTKPVVVISPKPTRPYGFKFENTEIGKSFEHYRLESYTCPESKMIGRLRETYSFGKACYKFISENHDSIDKIYANTWPLFAQYYAVKAAKKFHIPINIHVQDIYPESLTNKIPVIGTLIHAILKPIDNFVFRNSQHIIAISGKMKQYLSLTRNNSISKISVVSNWQDEQEFDAFKYNFPESSEKIFMYLGNIGPVAGLPLLIEAFKNANVDAKLVLAGSGSKKEECMNFVKRNSLSNIEFWDVPSGQVALIQSKASVLILPLIKGAASSSIPSKLPAYMFSARPIIVLADKDSDTVNAVIDANCGWVGDAEDTIWLTQKIIEVNKMRNKVLSAMGHNGRVYGVKNFSKEVNLQKLTSIIIK